MYSVKLKRNFPLTSVYCANAAFLLIKLFSLCSWDDKIQYYYLLNINIIYLKLVLGKTDLK